MCTSTAAIALIACVLVAAGCASSGTKESTTSVVSPLPAEPAGSTTIARPVVLPISPKGMRGIQPPQAARFLSPIRLAIAGILGSSNCPSVPKKLFVKSPHRIRIDLVVGSWGRTASGRRVQVLHRPGACLDDLHPVPLVIAVDPTRIDVHNQLKISLYYPPLVVRRFRRPVVVTAPPLATGRIREEVRIARDSNRLFSIFPAVPGAKRCLVPHNTAHGFRGICQTSIHTRRTEEPSWSVTFTESWWRHCPVMTACSTRALRHHTWQVIEGETIVKPGTKPRVYATHSRGATAPQYYK